MGIAGALDVAYYLVQRFNDVSKPTSNMKLQKVLYKSWIKYYRDREEYLFDEPFLAWKLGPVIKDVYMTYRYCGAMPIMFPKGKKPTLSKELMDFLNNIVDIYKTASASDMVADTHGDFPIKKISAWKTVYKEGKWDVEIPYSLIIEQECMRSNDG